MINQVKRAVLAKSGKLKLGPELADAYRGSSMLDEFSPFNLRNDLAVQAAKALDAKIGAAIREAFDTGKDFVRSANLTYDAGNRMAPGPLFEPVVDTISYQGGAIGREADTPAGFIRYHRPKDWRTGQTLR